MRRKATPWLQRAEPRELLVLGKRGARGTGTQSRTKRVQVQTNQDGTIYPKPKSNCDSQHGDPKSLVFICFGSLAVGFPSMTGGPLRHLGPDAKGMLSLRAGFKR